MIESITFTDKYGFLTEKVEKPTKPIPGQRSRVYGSETESECQEEYKRRLDYYKEHKDEYIVPCANNLIGKKFTFVPDKINLIFGPNASGKTTIIKCIAHQQLLSDGFITLKGPVDLPTVKLGERASVKDIKHMVEDDAPTSCKVVMDGAPIYWHNFASRNQYGIGDLVGSVFSDIPEEIMYTMDKNKRSSSQNQFVFMYKLLKIMSEHRTVDSLIKDFIDSCKYNKVWMAAYKAQYDYYCSFPNANDPNCINTFLFDELDASLDIMNIVALYTTILPQALDKYGQQIIIISHSPVVLSKLVYESDKYNIISMDEEYTNECRDKLLKCW